VCCHGRCAGLIGVNFMRLERRFLIDRLVDWGGYSAECVSLPFCVWVWVGVRVGVGMCMFADEE
jgi:hypothetical protein